MSSHNSFDRFKIHSKQHQTKAITKENNFYSLLWTNVEQFHMTIDKMSTHPLKKSKMYKQKQYNPDAICSKQLIYKDNIKIQVFFWLPEGCKIASLCRMTHLLFHLWQAVLEIWLWVGSQEAVPVGRWSISLPESGQSQQHLQWVGHKHRCITATALRRCVCVW